MEANNMTKLISLTLALSLSFVALAESTEFSDYRKTKVIHDSGGRTTIDYIKEVEFEEPEIEQRVFPVKTPEMTVGKVEADEGVNANLMVAVRPLFIIGYDRTSLQWLVENKDWLIEKGAVGYIANVDNAEQVEHLFRLVDNKVYMMPMNTSELAKQLNIRHYPFYMDKEGVMR